MELQSDAMMTYGKATKPIAGNANHSIQQDRIFSGAIIQWWLAIEG